VVAVPLLVSSAGRFWRIGIVFCKYSEVIDAVNSSISVVWSDVKVGLDMVRVIFSPGWDNMLVDLATVWSVSDWTGVAPAVLGDGSVDTGGAEIAVGTRRQDFAVGVCKRKLGKKAGTIVGNKLGALGKVIGWCSRFWVCWNYLMGLPSLQHRYASLLKHGWPPIP
jgi:hypothetical protein